MSGEFAQERQEEEENEIPNIYEGSKFKKHIKERIASGRLYAAPEELEKLNAIDDDEYVAEPFITLDNIVVLHNKDKFSFAPNPFIKPKEYEHPNEILNIENKSIIKTQVYIKRFISSRNIFITRYKYVCPRCQKEVTVLPYKLAGQIMHDNCFVDSKGNPKSTLIDKKKYQMAQGMNLYIYEAKLKPTDKDSFFIYTPDKDLNNSLYEVEMIIDHARLEYADTKARTILLMLNKAEVEFSDGVTEFVQKGSGIPFENKWNLPRMKLNDIRQAIVDIYDHYLDETITNEGAFAQYATLISGLGKLFFNYNKLGISIVGNKSLSKTYPVVRFAMMIDKEYYFSQNAEDMSAAGLKGGVGTIDINGTATKIFMHGVVTFAGLCVFDEGAKFFTDLEMNNHLKSLPQPVLHIDKIGAGQADQNYTPIILCNFTEFAKEYMEKVKSVYYDKKKSGDPRVSAVEVANELMEVNMFLPLYHYKSNVDLLEAIDFVRREYESNQIDWKTGGREEASNRLLFDVVVYNKEDMDNGQQDIEYTSLLPPEPRYLPIIQFQEELIRKYVKKPIDLYNFKNNTPETRAQLIELRNNITEWFKNSGNDVWRYFANGKRRIDSKLNNLIYMTIMIVMLIENNDATKLSVSVKDFMRYLLFKCKRGLLTEEYNFELNLNKIETVKTDVSKTQLEQHEKKEERLIKEAEKKLKEKQEKDDIDDEYIQGFGGNKDDKDRVLSDEELDKVLQGMKG